MASRIMHLAIANEIVKRISIRDFERFQVGSILPDAYANGISTAGVYEIMGVPLLFLEQNSLLFIPIIFGVVLGLIIMMVVYLRIEAKYKK